LLPRKGRRARCAILVVVLAAPGFAVPEGATAGTIGFRTDVEATTGPGADVKVTLTHTGDETAEDVSVRAELLDKSAETSVTPAIAPGQTLTYTLHLADVIPTGVYTVVVRTRYSDANGYPFEVVSTAAAPVGVQAAARMFGNIDVPRLPVAGEVKARLTVKKPRDRSGTFEADLVAPVGMEVMPKHVSLAFDANGKAVESFRVRNLKLLAGTTVNIFALVKGGDPGFTQVDAIRGTVSVAPRVMRVTTPMFYEVAGALFALLALLEGIAWATSGRRVDA
jgi:hypothetical protein